MSRSRPRIDHGACFVQLPNNDEFAIHQMTENHACLLQRGVIARRSQTVVDFPQDRREWNEIIDRVKNEITQQVIGGMLSCKLESKRFLAHAMNFVSQDRILPEERRRNTQNERETGDAFISFIPGDASHPMGEGAAIVPGFPMNEKADRVTAGGQELAPSKNGIRAFSGDARSVMSVATPSSPFHSALGPGPMGERWRGSRGGERGSATRSCRYVCRD